MGNGAKANFMDIDILLRHSFLIQLLVYSKIERLLDGTKHIHIIEAHRKLHQMEPENGLPIVC